MIGLNSNEILRFLAFLARCMHDGREIECMKPLVYISCPRFGETFLKSRVRGGCRSSLDLFMAAAKTGRDCLIEVVSSDAEDLSSRISKYYTNGRGVEAVSSYSK